MVSSNFFISHKTPIYALILKMDRYCYGNWDIFGDQVSIDRVTLMSNDGRMVYRTNDFKFYDNLREALGVSEDDSISPSQVVLIEMDGRLYHLSESKQLDSWPDEVAEGAILVIKFKSQYSKFNFHMNYRLCKLRFGGSTLRSYKFVEVESIGKGIDEYIYQSVAKPKEVIIYELLKD